MTAIVSIINIWEPGSPCDLGIDATTAPRRAPSCERGGRRIPTALFTEPGGGNRFRLFLEQHASARSSPRGVTTSAQRQDLDRAPPIFGVLARGNATDGQISASRHFSHRGRRARHTLRP